VPTAAQQRSWRRTQACRAEVKARLDAVEEGWRSKPTAHEAYTKATLFQIEMYRSGHEIFQTFETARILVDLALWVEWRHQLDLAT